VLETTGLGNVRVIAGSPGMNDIISALFEFVIRGMGWLAEVTSRVRPSDPAAHERLQNSIERNPRFNDPVYKKNLQRLIERNRRFEETRE
jgi:hypothetical protein